MNGNYTEFRAVEKELSHKNELLFEAFSSKRAFEVEREVFEMYMREKISARILCGKDLHFNDLQRQDLQKPKTL